MVVVAAVAVAVINNDSVLLGGMESSAVKDVVCESILLDSLNETTYSASEWTLGVVLVVAVINDDAVVVVVAVAAAINNDAVLLRGMAKSSVVKDVVCDSILLDSSNETTYSASEWTLGVVLMVAVINNDDVVVVMLVVAAVLNNDAVLLRSIAKSSAVRDVVCESILLDSLNETAYSASEWTLGVVLVVAVINNDAVVVAVAVAAVINNDAVLLRGMAKSSAVKDVVCESILLDSSNEMTYSASEWTRPYDTFVFSVNSDGSVVDSIAFLFVCYCQY